MSITGPQALAALDEALRDIRREEDEILRKLMRGLERAAKIRDTEGDLLRQFAATRLPSDRAAELGGEVARAGIAARQALTERAAAMATAAERLRHLERGFAERVAARASALEDIDGQQAALRALSPRIAAAIAREPEYERQRQIVGTLKATAAAARGKVRQADLDREQQGRPFREDQLYSYLASRGYGTPAYRGMGLTAWLDARLARLIGFEAARRHYGLLDRLPGALRGHAEQQARRAVEAEDRLDELEWAAIDAAGGAEVRAGLAIGQATAAAIDGQLLALQDERDRAVAAQTQLAEADDAGFGAAVGNLVRALGSPDLSSAIGAMRAHGRGADDPLIAQLDDARLRVAEEQADSRDQHARLATLASRRRSLEDIEFELKARRFDDPRSLFRDDNLIGARLDNFLTGALGAETYWAMWRSGQAWNAGTSDWGGGVGLPRHGREAAETGPAPVQPNFSRPRSAAAGAGA